MTGSQLYKSFPLPPALNYIRLLEVEPNLSPERNTIISGKLRIVNLDEHPSFSALSYVCGNDAHSASITCEGFDVKITQNCHSALQHLRRKLGQFSIWIDSVCIHQADESEKAQQIQLMGQIYSRAKTVYVWLGEGNERSDRAINYLATAGLLEYYSPSNGSGGNASTKPKVWPAVWSVHRRNPFPTGYLHRGLSRLFWRLATSIRSSAVKTSYEDLADLLLREWISRMWTYQEMLLASNAIVVCGESHLEWSRLSWSIIFLAYSGVNDQRGVTRISSMRAWTRVTFSKGRLTTLHENRVSSVTSLQLDNSQLTEYFAYQRFLHSVFRRYNIIWMSFFPVQLFILVGVSILLNVKAPPESDPHRRLYDLMVAPIVTILAFTGIISMYWAGLRFPNLTSPFEQDLPRDDLVDAISARKATDPRDKAFAVRAILQRLSKDALSPPDYTLSLGQIYVDLCHQLIRATDPTRLLLPAALNRCPGQPSWVPDWSKELPDRWHDHLFLTRRRTDIVSSSQSLWKLDPHNEGVLIVQGRQLGVVSDCFRFEIARGNEQANEKVIHLENMRSMLKFMNFVRYNVVNFLFYFRRSHKEFTLPRKKLLEAWVDYFVPLRQKPPSEVLSRLEAKGAGTFSSLFSSLLIHHTSIREILQTQISICNYLAETRQTFFVCKNLDQSVTFRRTNKHYIGICTNDARQGDKVVLFSGLSSLLVVRSERHAAQLISPAIFRRINQRGKVYMQPEYVLQKREFEEYSLC